MHPRFSRILPVVALLALALGCGSSKQADVTAPAPPAASPPAPADPPAPSAPPITGVVFSATNDAAANSILVMAPAADGTLSVTATVPTGGKGSGGGLQNQGGVALNEDRSLLFVVNAGSDDFSVFRVNGSTLTLASQTPSGGKTPVSISTIGGVVYVLNDGSRAASTDNISGFTVAADGKVAAIPNATQPLSADATGGAQVSIGPAGDLVLVTERTTAILNVFPLDANGVAGPGTANVSVGTIPFGFQFLDATHVFISEEGPNAVSSYTISGSAMQPITRSAPNFQSGTCWLAITPSGRFLYTTNTSARSISAFSIAATGATALIGSTGVAVQSTGLPLDAIVSLDGQYLVVVNVGGSMDVFRIAADGSLTLRQTLTGLGSGLNGVVAA